MKRLTERRKNGAINVRYATEHETAIHRLAAIEDILGDDYHLDRLCELVEADRAGRCVVLPCKVGDTVYQENGVDVFELQVKNIIFDCGYVAFDSSAIGTLIYLTHEAAEAALKAREQDG